MKPSFRLEQDAGLTPEIDKYIRSHNTRACSRLMDVLISDRDFNDPVDYDELKVAIESVKNEMAWNVAIENIDASPSSV